MPDENIGNGEPLNLTDAERAVLPQLDPNASSETADLALLSAGGSAHVDIPDGWRDLHWKQVVSLARQIDPSQPTIDLEDARRIIADELALRDAPKGDDGLVEMAKAGETLRVNPATVDAHKKAGWKLV